LFIDDGILKWNLFFFSVVLQMVCGTGIGDEI
jgi:hypothetical protein